MTQQVDHLVPLEQLPNDFTEVNIFTIVHELIPRVLGRLL
jgi:hypothetical protein